MGLIEKSVFYKGRNLKDFVSLSEFLPDFKIVCGIIACRNLTFIFSVGFKVRKSVFDALCRAKLILLELKVPI